MSIEDQPPPTPQPDRLPVWQLVIDEQRNERQSQTCGCYACEAWRNMIDDMTARDAVGRERYGTPLTTHNGRDHLVDAYQEALDLVVYLRADHAERSGGDLYLYNRAISMALDIRGEINRRARTKTCTNS